MERAVINFIELKQIRRLKNLLSNRVYFAFSENAFEKRLNVDDYSYKETLNLFCFQIC